MEFVVLGIVFGLALVGLMKPYIGLLSLLIVMELQPSELYPQLMPLHLERVVAGLLVVSFLVHGEKLRIVSPIPWFLAFYGAMIASIPMAFWPGMTAQFCIDFLEIVVFVLFVTALLKTEERIRWFIVTWVLLVDWLGGSALFNYSRGIVLVRMNIERVVGLTSSAGDADTLALTLVYTVPFAILLMLRTNPTWMRILGVVSVCCYAVTLVFTGSRAGALAAVFLILLLLIRKPKNLLYLPVVLALAPMAWLVIPEQYKARYETVNNLKGDASYQIRLLSWQGGIAMFESSPLTGIGAGNYANANGKKFWPGMGTKHYLNAHSLYFKLLGELGLVGIFTFGGYLVCVFRMNLRLRKQLRARGASDFLQLVPDMLLLILLSLLFDGYAAHNLYRETWFLVGAMTACLNLLPIPDRAAQPEGTPHLVEGADLALESKWSPALLPALRK